MFNANQFKPLKVKKPYTGPPRPNLMSHDKTIREGKVAFDVLCHRVDTQRKEINLLHKKIRYLEHSINLLNANRGGK